VDAVSQETIFTEVLFKEFATFIRQISQFAVYTPSSIVSIALAQKTE